MDEDALERARDRINTASERRAEPADVDAALERARAQLEALAEFAAGLESTLPRKIDDAVREGLRAEAHPVGRNVAEVRGLANQTIRRLERLEGDLVAERHARVDDLALLVELISSGWTAVEDRLARIDERLAGTGGAVVYRIEERQERRTSNS